MYFGKPVVVSDCKSIEKIIKENECGLPYPDRNPEVLAERLKYLYENPAECKRLGENGHKAVVEQYNWDRTVEGLLRIYNSK